MTVLIAELYDALLAAGTPDDKARKAAEAVVARNEAATKTDLAQLEARLLKWQFAQWATLVVLIIGTAALK